MPLNEIKYQNTVIYKIQHIEKDDLLYIGHTTDFTKRKYSHKANCTNENTKKYNFKLYVMIRENGGWESFKMLEIKKFPCSDKREAEAEEDRIMREAKTSMNTVFLVKINHKEYQKEYNKNYYSSQKEILKERSRAYNESQKKVCQCQCGQSISLKVMRQTKHLQSKRHKDGIIALQ